MFKTNEPEEHSPENVENSYRTMTLALITGFIAIAVVLAVYFTTPLDGASGDPFWRFLGRFHPLALHFPVTCLVLTGLFELARLSPRGRFLASYTGPLFYLSAITALVTVVLGMLLAANEGHSGELITRHKIRGVGVALLAIVAAVIYFVHTLYHKAWLRYAYQSILVLAIGLMSLAAHDGGSLVHGERYLSQFAPAPLAELFAPAQDKPRASETSDKQLQPLSTRTQDAFSHDIRPFFDQYCVRCHGAGRQEANIRFDQLQLDFSAPNDGHFWHRVQSVVQNHRMPPKDAKKPEPKARFEVVEWIEKALEEEAYFRRAQITSAPLRRLTKREFDYTLQDLFNVDISFANKLPADPKSEKGYDTDSELLLISMSDLKLYQDIVRDAVNRYVQVGERSDKRDYYFIEMEDVYYYGRGEGAEIAMQQAPLPVTKSEFEQALKRHQRQPVEYIQRQYGPLPFGPIPIGDVKDVGEGRGFARLHEQFVLLKTPHRSGKVTVRAHVAHSKSNSNDPTFPRLRVEAGWREDQSLRASVIGEKDITAELSQPEVVEFSFPLEQVLAPDSHLLDDGSNMRPLLLVLSNFGRHEQGILAASGEGQADPTLASFNKEIKAIRNQTKEGFEFAAKAMQKLQAAQVPFLHLDAIEVEITPTMSDPDNQWIVNRPTTPEQEFTVISELLTRFLPKAYRRNPSANEKAKFTQLFSTFRSSGDSFETALKETLAAVLISPQFLFINHPVAEDVPGDVERSLSLANNMAYLLWSSMPDETLLAKAQSGELMDSRVLSLEIERMLAHPHARRFSRNFAEQWLQLSKMDDISVSTEHFPMFDSDFQNLLAEESIASFQDIFHNDRDARDLYRSEYMYVNDQLARHYELDKVVGGDIQRVMVNDDRLRAGILSNASIMTMNSDGKDSHPIKRGVWLLERILDDPPPPPPPVVPDINDSDPLLAGLTLKEKIEHHRRQSACSGCHEKIDPWGIAFEHFNAVGQWRDTHGPDATNPNIDSAAVLPDGTQVLGVSTMAKHLLKNREKELMLGLVRHLMIYALGRDLDVVDEHNAETIFETFRASGYQLSTLMKGIIQSDAFTYRDRMNDTKATLALTVAE